MDYEIIEAGDLDALEKAVREKIAAGWEPQGGVAMYTLEGGDYYAQAMKLEVK